MITMTLYGKPGCHLCEATRADLAWLEEEFNLAITEVDITTDPQLFARFGDAIPVLATPAGEFKYPINLRAVQKAMRHVHA